VRRPAKTCPVCESGARVLDYKDDRTLSRFLTERGKILPSRLSGCAHVTSGSSRPRSSARGSWRCFPTSRVTPHSYETVVVAPAAGADSIRAVGAPESGGSAVRRAPDHRARRRNPRAGIRLVAADRRTHRRVSLALLVLSGGTGTASPPRRAPTSCSRRRHSWRSYC